MADSPLDEEIGSPAGLAEPINGHSVVGEVNAIDDDAILINDALAFVMADADEVGSSHSATKDVVDGHLEVDDINDSGGHMESVAPTDNEADADMLNSESVILWAQCFVCIHCFVLETNLTYGVL